MVSGLENNTVFGQSLARQGRLSTMSSSGLKSDFRPVLIGKYRATSNALTDHSRMMPSADKVHACRPCYGS